jgi:non-heme chloroperoxidase
MSTITTQDGTRIFYKDWGSGQPVVFSHGWPLSADDWDTQMLFFLQHGYRVIAHDRRGHGRSTQTSDGHDMDHYADDLAALSAHLDLQDAVHIGHSTGGGEVVHYIARHGESRVAKAVLISAVPPLMVQTEANPGGLPKSVFDDPQAQLAANRSEFYRALPSGPFYGFNRPGVESSEAIIENCHRWEKRLWRPVPTAGSSRSLMASRSVTLALWTLTSSTNPCVSTSRWRFLPFTFLAPL